MNAWSPVSSSIYITDISIANSSQLIAEATYVAYKSATLDVQGRIRRVAEVWRDRQVFEPSILSDIESRIGQVDQARGSGKKSTLGGTLSSSIQPSVAPELQPLVSNHASLTRSENTSASVNTAIAEDDKFDQSDAEKPTLPVQANRLGALLKAVANAEGAVAERVKARKSVIQDLEKLIESHRAKLIEDEALVANLAGRKRKRQEQKTNVEHEIMQSMSNENEPQRPDDEPLTPPPVESLTPVGSPKAFIAGSPIDRSPQPTADQIAPLNSVVSAQTVTVNEAPQHVPVAKSPVNGEGPQAKKRKLGSQSLDEEAAFDPAMMGDLDGDVAAMLEAK